MSRLMYEYQHGLFLSHNAERVKLGIPPLVAVGPLMIPAQGHSLEMANRKRLGHDGNDGSQVWNRIDKTGYLYNACGENIAMGYLDVINVMAAWMKSTGHRNNILNPNFTQIGVGISINDLNTIYWDVVFARPRSKELINNELNVSSVQFTLDY